MRCKEWTDTKVQLHNIVSCTYREGKKKERCIWRGDAAGQMLRKANHGDETRKKLKTNNASEWNDTHCPRTSLKAIL